MKCEAEKKDEYTLVVMNGSMKSEADYNAFKSSIDAVLKSEEKNIILDMEDVDYINSSGLGRLILTAKKTMEVDGGLKVIKLKDDLKELFTITRLNERIEIFDSEEEATNPG